MELWNHVTMSYRRHDDGSLEPLPQRNVDTGMGLERLMMVVQGQASVYGCDVFQPWTAALTGLWRPGQRSLRLLADHLRSSIVIIGDGVTPSSTGRGYVLRRLIRRALTVLWHPDGTRTLDDLPALLVEQTLALFGQPEPPGRIGEVLRAVDHLTWVRYVGDRGREAGNGVDQMVDQHAIYRSHHGQPTPAAPAGWAGRARRSGAVGNALTHGVRRPSRRVP